MTSESMILALMLVIVLGLVPMGTTAIRNKSTTKVSDKKISSGPYRTPAEVPAPLPEPPPPKQPKPKREWKMPNVKLNKVSKCFMWLLPVCGAAVAIGALCDAPLLGMGLKIGFGVASGLVGLFCCVMVFVTADSKG